MTVLPRPFDNYTSYEGHGGIDYPEPRNTPVRASGSGVIDWSGYYSQRGGYAKFITYDCGCRHGYYHFDREQGLKRGARVVYGQVFAYVGGLGLYSTGPHLHHEVWNGHSSIIRPPQYWNYVDRNRYVGDGSMAGGIVKPERKIEDDMGIVIVAGNKKGWITKGMAFADNFTEPLTVLTVAEIGALNWWSQNGIPYRKAEWSAEDILTLIKQRGVRPVEGVNEYTNYDAVNY